jgi:hypothetical protein
MTTNIEVTCHPFNAPTGEPLEVVIETWDNGNLVSTVKGNQGDILKNIVCYYGREIRITESIKE